MKICLINRFGLGKLRSGASSWRNIYLHMAHTFGHKKYSLSFHIIASRVENVKHFICISGFLLVFYRISSVFLLTLFIKPIGICILSLIPLRSVLRRMTLHNRNSLLPKPKAVPVFEIINVFRGSCLQANRSAG